MQSICINLTKKPSAICEECVRWGILPVNKLKLE